MAASFALLAWLPGLAVGQLPERRRLEAPRQAVARPPGLGLRAVQEPIRASTTSRSSPTSLLRGRCRSCGTPIGWRHPAVEATTALLIAALRARLRRDPEAAAAIVFVSSSSSSPPPISSGESSRTGSCCRRRRSCSCCGWSTTEHRVADSPASSPPRSSSRRPSPTPAEWGWGTSSSRF